MAGARRGCVLRRRASLRKAPDAGAFAAGGGFLSRTLSRGRRTPSQDLRCRCVLAGGPSSQDPRHGRVCAGGQLLFAGPLSADAFAAGGGSPSQMRPGGLGRICYHGKRGVSRETPACATRAGAAKIMAKKLLMEMRRSPMRRLRRACAWWRGIPARLRRSLSKRWLGCMRQVLRAACTWSGPPTRKRARAFGRRVVRGCALPVHLQAGGPQRGQRCAHELELRGRERRPRAVRGRRSRPHLVADRAGHAPVRLLRKAARARSLHA